MKKEIGVAMLWAGGMIVLALGATAAYVRGYIDAQTLSRIVALNGLYIAYYGNSVPKKFVPSAYVRQVNRFCGWSLTLSGLTYAGFWGFAPLPMAMIFGTGAVVLGMALTLSYCLWLRGRTRTGA
jgi:hypothetical protein